MCLKKTPASERATEIQIASAIDNLLFSRDAGIKQVREELLGSNEQHPITAGGVRYWVESVPSWA